MIYDTIEARTVNFVYQLSRNNNSPASLHGFGRKGATREFY